MPTSTLHPPGAAVRAVLLDIDGTLIDSNDAHARAWVRAFADHGYVVPFDDVRRLVGKGGDKLVPETVGLDPGSTEGQAIAARRAEHFEAERPSLRATRGARALLEALTARGYTLVVATSATAPEVDALLGQAMVGDLIHAASSADDADHSKPDPDIVQAALARAGVHPSQAVMIGDTPYDVEAATRARVPCIALRCGGWWDDAALAGAVAVLDDPMELASEWERLVGENRQEQ